MKYLIAWYGDRETDTIPLFITPNRELARGFVRMVNDNLFDYEGSASYFFELMNPRFNAFLSQFMDGEKLEELMQELIIFSENKQDVNDMDTCLYYSISEYGEVTNDNK